MRTIGAVVFPGFELLDLFGPLEMFGLQSREFDIRLVAENRDPVVSNQGPRSVPDAVFDDGQVYDLLLIPGGSGTRVEVCNAVLLDWLREKSATAQIAASVCTGAALLARAGLLDARQATTNKLAWRWATSQGPHVLWQKNARWIEDGRFWSSSGVSAGIDMSLAMIAVLLGEDVASRTADLAEYHWQRNPAEDRFAKLHGL